MTTDINSKALRSWLFIDGADETALAEGPASEADVLIQELEDFTPPEMRPRAREISPGVLAAWKAAGVVTAVRVNPLDGDGMADLTAIMRGAPDIVMLPKTAAPRHIVELIAHATEDRFVYRHVWTKDDVVMWDNRCTMHAVEPFDNRIIRRVMHRVTLVGEEKPIPAV